METTREAQAMNDPQEGGPKGLVLQRLIRWAIVLIVVAVVLILPRPSGITSQSWTLLAIFLGTITGSILRPIAGGAMVLLGVSAVAITGALPIRDALGGYADPIVWMVLAAFFIARAMVKTGLGHRIALLFIRIIGHRTLGLGYALVSTEFLLASIIPSTGARCRPPLAPAPPRERACDPRRRSRRPPP